MLALPPVLLPVLLLSPVLVGPGASTGTSIGAGTGTGTATGARPGNMGTEMATRMGTGPSAAAAAAPLNLSQPIDAFGFKKLSHEGLRNPSVSMLSPATSTFSINMAPPSTRSESTGLGMNSPEETIVKKLALDRMEQDEANRHMDMALLNDKSSSLALNEPSMKNNSKAKFTSQSVTLSPTQILSKHADKQQAEPQGSPLSKRKKRTSNRSQEKQQTKASGSGTNGPVPVHKNPSFTVDRKHNKIVIGSSVREPETKPKGTADKKLF